MTASNRAHYASVGFIVGTTAAACHALPRAAIGIAVIGVVNRGWVRPLVPFWLLVLGCLAGVAATGIWNAEHKPGFSFERSETLTGTISEAPDIRSDHQLLTLTPDDSGAAVLLNAGRYPLRQYGERLKVTGIVDHPTTLNGFDYPLFLERFGILGTEMRPKKIESVGYAPFSPITATLYTLRGKLERSIDLWIPEPEASFMAGIMLGSKRAIPANVQSDLKTTGTMHIVAISGENITILLIILLKAMPVVSMRRKFWLTLLIAAFMSTLTGNPASVIRGAAIASLISWVRAHSRRAWPVSLLLAGTTACLIFNPLLLAADPGFQLSLAAFAGLLFFGPICTRRISKPPLNRLPPLMAGALAETVAATLGTLPLDFRLFGQLSLNGFVVNPLVLWLIPPITSLGLLYILAGSLPGVIALLKMPLWLLLHAMLSLISWFGSWGIGVIHWQISWWLTALLYAAIFWFLRKYGHEVG